MTVLIRRHRGRALSARPSMMAAGAPIKAGGPSNLLRKSVPPPPLRGASACAPAALTDTPATIAMTLFSIGRTM